MNLSKSARVHDAVPIARADKALTSHHCSCSSTSHLFISRLRLAYWSTLKIANDLPIFASYYAFVIVSLTWLAYFLSRDYLSYINSLGSLFIFRFSLTKGQWRYTDHFIFRFVYTFYIKVFYLNNHHIAVWGCKNACNVY